MTIRRIIANVGYWISDLPCRLGFHDFGEWQENTYRNRVWFDWYRDCHQCDRAERLPIGDNPPGQQHSAPRKFGSSRSEMAGGLLS